jgi:S-adenosylmethionine:tRNA ribosyltransferase-isomerase
MITYKLEDYDFDLPESRVAAFPLPEREKSKLMHLARKSGKVRHLLFEELGKLL